MRIKCEIKNTNILKHILENPELDAVLRERHPAGARVESDPQGPKMIPKSLKYLYPQAIGADGGSKANIDSGNGNKKPKKASDNRAGGSLIDPIMICDDSDQCDDDFSDYDVEVMDDDGNKKKRKRNSKDIESKPWIPPDIGGFSIKDGAVIEDRREQPINPLRDSSSLYVAKDSENLWKRFAEDGYVYIKGAISRDVILQARKDLYESLRSLKIVNSINQSLINGNKEKVVVSIGYKQPIQMDKEMSRWKGQKVGEDWVSEQWRALTERESLARVSNSSAVRDIIHMLAKGKSHESKGTKVVPMKFGSDLSWIRLMPPNGYTPEHADVFYMREAYQEAFEAVELSAVDRHNARCKKCSLKSSKVYAECFCFECGDMVHLNCLKDQQWPGDRWFCDDCMPQHTLGTCWIPLGDVDIREGVLAFLHTSNRTIPHMDKAAKLKGVTKELPHNYFNTCKSHAWHVGHYDAGDVVLFDGNTIHCTATNKSESLRVSTDFRFYLQPQRRNVRETVHYKELVANAAMTELK